MCFDSGAQSAPVLIAGQAYVRHDEPAKRKKSEVENGKGTKEFTPHHVRKSAVLIDCRGPLQS